MIKITIVAVEVVDLGVMMGHHQDWLEISMMILLGH